MTADAYVIPFPQGDTRMGKPFMMSTVLHALILFFIFAVATQVTVEPLPQVKVLEINVIGKEDLALKGTANDYSVGPLPDKTMLAQPSKDKGPVVKGNTPKLSKGLQTKRAVSAPVPVMVPTLKARGALFNSAGSISSPGVGREKIYVSAKTVKVRTEDTDATEAGEGLVGVSGGAIDLSSKRGGGGPGGGTGNILGGGEGNINGGSTLSRRGEPILAGYSTVSTDPILQPKKKKMAELEAPSDAFFSITGPLKGRKILKMGLPKYPRWAEEQGLEAQVAVRITVTAGGKVKQDMLVEQTSGFPEFDKVVLDAVRKMLFAPLPPDAGMREEWGVTTFNFKLKKRSL